VVAERIPRPAPPPRHGKTSHSLLDETITRTSTMLHDADTLAGNIVGVVITA
jgi:hypothetical protein